MSSPPSIPVEDRISALPDPLICHILSFLPTKLAVTTSVLSKRWTPLWRSVLTLDFDEESFPDFAMFRHSVYSVIVSRDITLPIQSFRIKCGSSENFDPFDVNRFVHAAAQRQIENFDLHLSGNRLGKRKNLTTGVLRVLSCRTLVTLKLKNLIVYDVPQLVHLPLLKTLNLDFVSFAGSFALFNNLVRGCPILEDFHTNVVEVFGDCEMDREFEGFPYLLKANLSVFPQNLPLRWFHNTKFLYVDMWFFYVDFYVDDGVPTFLKLTDMELFFHFCFVRKYECVIAVLQHCPKLQNLTLEEADEEKEPDEGENEDLEDLEIFPECVLSQLRTCCFRGFGGYPRELQFVEYIMMNSKLLSTMTIKCGSWVDGIRKQQMLGKLSSYPRGSPTCKLLFD